MAGVLNEISDNPLAILLFHEKAYFPILLDCAIDEGFADLVLFLSEADQLRRSIDTEEKDGKAKCANFARIYNTYLLKPGRKGVVMEVIEKYGVPHAHLKKAIDSRMPTPTLFASICDCIWKEVLLRLKQLPKSPMWVSVRRALIEEKTSMELIKILTVVHFRKNYEDFIVKHNPDELKSLNCWLELYTIIDFVQARNDGTPMSGGTGEEFLEKGESLQASLEDLYLKGEGTSSRKFTMHERLKMAQISTASAAAAGVDTWDFDSKLMYMLSSARDVAKVYYPANTVESRSPFPPGVSKATRLEFMALMRDTQSVHIADVEALDKGYATKLSADLWRLLKAIQRDIFQHLQVSLPRYFDSVDFVMMVTVDKLLASPGVAAYYRRLLFLEREVAQNNIVRWNHAQAKGMTHISCRAKKQGQGAQQAPSQLRDFFLQFAPSQAAQLRALKCMRPGKELNNDHSLALLLRVLPLHILVQALFLLLGGKSVVVVSHAFTALRQLLAALPRFVIPFHLQGTHQTLYFSTASEFAVWIGQQGADQDSIGNGNGSQTAYLIGASHEALSGLRAESKYKLIALFSKAHLQSSGRGKGSFVPLDPLSNSYVGDFPASDNNICVLDVDLGDLYFHHGDETVSGFTNVRSEKADIMTNVFSVRKFESQAFASLRSDVSTQQEAMERAIMNSVGGYSSKVDNMDKVLVTLIERSNDLVELAFARYFSNVVLRFLPTHLYFFAQYSVAICDVKAVLADLLGVHHHNNGNGGNGSGGDVSADSIRITYGLSDMEIGFGTDLVSGSRPSLVMLMNNAGITAFQNTV